MSKLLFNSPSMLDVERDRPPICFNYPQAADLAVTPGDFLFAIVKQLGPKTLASMIFTYPQIIYPFVLRKKDANDFWS